MTKDINMNCGMTVILYSHFMTKDINDDAAEKLKFQVEFVCPAHYRIYKTYLWSVSDILMRMLWIVDSTSPKFEVASDWVFALLR